MVNVALPENGLGNTIPGLVNSETEWIPVLTVRTKVPFSGKVMLSLVRRFVAVILSIRVSAPVAVKVMLMFCPYETRELSGLAGIIPWLTVIWLSIVLGDLAYRHQLGAAVSFDFYSCFFLIEFILVAAGSIILYKKKSSILALPALGFSPPERQT